MSKIFTCDICGKQEIGYPNNPFPYLNEGSCCMKCNFEKVLPLRILGLSVSLYQREQYIKEKETSKCY